MGLERMVSILLITTLLLAMQAAVCVVYGEALAVPERQNSTLRIALSSADKLQKESSTEQNSVDTSASVNPHWDKTQCSACHESEIKKGAPGLRAADDEGLCMDCHKEDVVHKYIHPVGPKLSQKKKKIISEKWGGKLRLDDKDRLTCQTCHDLLDQCLPGRSYQAKRNPQFLRGGPYSKRHKLCYRCHDASKYKRLNSHDQITDNGKLKTNKCRLCHEVRQKDRLKSGIKRDLSRYPLIDGLNEDRTLLCIRCHRKIDHPSGSFSVKSIKEFRHLVRIENKKKETLEKQNIETGIVFPLEPNTGRIYCGTCHEPHQPGVFAGETQAAAPKTKNRLRAKSVCTHCHDK
ncbi:MAG: hypothetical protein KZQ88_18485 [Candidatus Thiodiazotropha sp. (ex Dulcina madagascariensis)]|nr:hypothetical protein [Candidatus Thiodiazotropha sp. (ex Dulcina madagascariensis)]